MLVKLASFIVSITALSMGLLLAEAQQSSEDDMRLIAEASNAEHIGSAAKLKPWHRSQWFLPNPAQDALIESIGPKWVRVRVHNEGYVEGVIQLCGKEILDCTVAKNKIAVMTSLCPDLVYRAIIDVDRYKDTPLDLLGASKTGLIMMREFPRDNLARVILSPRDVDPMHYMLMMCTPSIGAANSLSPMEFNTLQH